MSDPIYPWQFYAQEYRAHREAIKVRIDNVGTPAEGACITWVPVEEFCLPCIDPNAEMQQRDYQGILNGGPSKKLLEAARKLRETTKKLDDALRPRDPGQGLDVVAPMDHRLGRFNCC